MFVLTSLPVGGAETLLHNLVRTLDRRRIRPLVCCLKEAGELGEQMSVEVPLYSRLLRGKYDAFVLQRLAKLFRRESVDAVVTVGAGDKMFWGRLAARLARVPVVLSALHSTGWPDGVGRMNRWLTPLTDGFIAVARPHGKFLVEFEKFPEQKVFVIPNGIDTERFRPSAVARAEWRQRWEIEESAPV
ncbi:MAG: glycosyltransferase, partial [Planctomycetota bacterium]